MILENTEAPVQNRTLLNLKNNGGVVITLSNEATPFETDWSIINHTSGNFGIRTLGSAVPTFEITRTGMIGIGTSSPQAVLDVVAGPALLYKHHVTVSSSYLVSHANNFIKCTGGAYSVMLPKSVLGKEYIIKNSGSGIINVVPYGIENIDGVSNKMLYTHNESITLVGDYNGWDIVSHYTNNSKTGTGNKYES
jgi:hypothetical protein